MKRALNLLFVVSSAVLLSGCATFGPAFDDAAEKVDGKRLGRFVTIAYMSQKDNMKPEHREVVETVYKEFRDLVEAPDVGDVAKEKLTTIVRTALKEKPDLAMLAVEIIDMYWDELQAKYDIDAMIGENRLKVLRDFNDGIKEALEEYKLFREPSPKEGDE